MTRRFRAGDYAFDGPDRQSGHVEAVDTPAGEPVAHGVGRARGHHRNAWTRRCGIWHEHAPTCRRMSLAPSVSRSTSGAARMRRPSTPPVWRSPTCRCSSTRSGRSRSGSTAVASEAAAPAVIYCHAGAFVLGNLDTDHRQCVEFARRAGCTVISVDYRLAPEHPYPAGARRRPRGAGVGGGRGRASWASTPTGWPSRATVPAVRWRRGLAQCAADGSAPPLVFQLLHQPVLDDRPSPVEGGVHRHARDSTVPRPRRCGATTLAGQPSPPGAVPAAAGDLTGSLRSVHHLLGTRSAARRGRRLRAAADVGRRRDRTARLPGHLPRIRLAGPRVGDQPAVVRHAGRGAAAGAAPLDLNRWGIVVGRRGCRWGRGRLLTVAEDADDAVMVGADASDVTKTLSA